MDWKKVEHDYVINGLTIDKIVEKYNVSRVTICKHSKAGNWAERKKEHQYAKESSIKQAVAEADIEHAKVQAVKAMKFAEYAVDKLLETLAQQADELIKLPPASLQAWVKSLESAIKMARDVHNLPNDMDRQKLEIALADLKMRSQLHEKEMNSDGTEEITVTFEDKIGEYVK